MLGRLSVLVLATLLFVAPMLGAQKTPRPRRGSSMDWVISNCTDAVASAKRGYGNPQFTEALGRLQGCGTEGADAAAVALRSLRTASDTTVLDSLTWNFQTWRDAALFDAGLRLARNATATPESRVFAIRYLYSTVRPDAGNLPYGALARSATHRCSTGYTSSGFGEGRPLAPNYPDVLRRLGNQLVESTTEPLPVRAAAACLATIPKGLPVPQPRPARQPARRS